MENWVLEYDVISSFAKHYETRVILKLLISNREQEILPKELFDKIEKSKTFRAASSLVSQVLRNYGTFI